MLIKAKQSAFTLIELGIIIAIIGIMSAVAVTQMMDLTGNAEEAVLQDYLQKLNSGAAQYLVSQGKRPTKFSDFVVEDTSELTTANVADGKTVPLLYNKNNEAMCTTTVPTTQTLTCEPDTDSPGISNRKAIYTMSNGMITAVITDVETD
jgi:type II secretory pathway pseudopilin PulG